MKKQVEVKPRHKIEILVVPVVLLGQDTRCSWTTFCWSLDGATNGQIQCKNEKPRLRQNIFCIKKAIIYRILTFFAVS